MPLSASQDKHHCSIIVHFITTLAVITFHIYTYTYICIYSYMYTIIHKKYRVLDQYLEGGTPRLSHTNLYCKLSFILLGFWKPTYM